MKAAVASLLLSGGSLAALAYLAKHNRDKHSLTILEMRDTSRDSYKSYGLNFGFKTDQAIEEMLDSGDLLLVYHDCSQDFSVLSNLL
jgi:hypothetical protein